MMSFESRNSSERAVALLSSTLLAVLAACSGDSTGSQSVASVSVSPSSVTVILGDTTQLTGTARDAAGGAIPEATVVWTSDNQGVATVSQEGRVVGAGVGQAAVTATAAGKSGSSAITVLPAPASQVAFTVQPTDTEVGRAIAPPVEVEIRDRLGNRIASATSAVTLTIENNPAGGNLLGTTTENAANGVATFSDVSIDQVGSGYTLRAVSGSLTAATSDAFDVVVIPAAQLAFSVQPSNAWVDSVIAPEIQVEVRDQFGVLIAGNQDAVTLTLGSNPGGATLVGNGTVDASDGVAIFPGLSINRAGAHYTLAASSGSLAAESDSFNLTVPSVWYGNDLGTAVGVIDPYTNTVDTAIVAGARPYGIAITPDGLFAYTANRGAGSVTVIATTTYGVVTTISVGVEPIWVMMTPDGAHAYVSNRGDNTVSVIETATNSVIDTIQVGPIPDKGAVTPDGRFVYVPNWGSNFVSVIEVASNTVVDTVIVGSNPAGLAITPDGSFAYIANSNTQVSVVDLANNTVTATIPVGAAPHNPAITPNGEFVYVPAESGNTVSKIATATNTVVTTLSLFARPTSAAVSPDGKFVYVTNYNSATVAVHSVSTNLGTSIPVGGRPGDIVVMPAPKQ
jgi:YVTN family beta-propeller protein